MKTRYLLLLPIATLLIQVSTAIASQARPLSPSPSAEIPNREIPTPPWARNLDLSADQRSQLQTIRLQAIQESEQPCQQLMDEEEKLRSLLQSDASIQQIREQHQQVQQLRQQLDTQQFETLLAERQVLTPEQLAIVVREAKDSPHPPR